MFWRKLDPLDLEIVERVLEAAANARNATEDLESDEELERALRAELAEIVRVRGTNDIDALLDAVLDVRPRKTEDHSTTGTMALPESET
jgi:hypothetical protein